MTLYFVHRKYGIFQVRLSNLNTQEKQGLLANLTTFLDPNTREIKNAQAIKDTLEKNNKPPGD